MRNVCSAAVLALSILSCSLVAQSQPLTIASYSYVSQVAVRPTQWQVTFSATVVNSGPALGSVTATISNAPYGVTVIGGEDVLNFGAVPANGQAVSTNTFTILDDRTVNPAPSITQLQWTFQSTPALPVANAGTAQTVAVGATVTLDGSGSTNPGMDGTLTYAWTLQAPFGSSAQLSFATSVHPTFKTDVVGQYVATLTVSNGTNSSTPAQVTVSTTNSAPVANPGTAQTVTAGTTVQLNGSGSTDVDGDTLTYSWTLQVPPGSGSTATLSNANIVNPTFYADKPGTYTATLTVNDGHGNTNSNSVQITTLNSPPVANAGAAQVVSIGTTVTLDGSKSTDVDGDTLTYSWSFTSKATNSTATLTNPTSVNPTFYVDQPGEYDIQLIVNDGHNNSNTATTKVTTSAVLAPTANPGTAQTVTVGATVTLNGSGTDPNVPPLPLQYSWSLTCKPTGSHAGLSSTSIQDPTFTADIPTSNPGTCASNFVAQLIVSNGYVSSTPQTVNITSNATPPTANPGSPQTVNVGTPVTVSGSTSSDTNGDAISSYSWSITSAPGGSSITTANLTTPTAVSTSFTPDVAGQYVVQLIVKDSYLTSTPVSVTITANAVPTISVTPSTLTVASNDNTQTLTVTLSTAPGGSGQTVILHNNGSAATVPSTVSFSATQTTATVNVTPNFAGSETITASAGGWVAGSATINVVTPAITLTLDSAVGLTHSKPGTITLSLAAPSPNGVTVALSANPTGIVSFDNANVVIGAGSTTGSFNVTGQSTGTTTISASASGWVGASQSMLVASSGTISLPTTVTLGTGQSQSYNVALTNPAPIGGVTITLNSSDPTNVIFNPSTVTINQGFTTPTSMPQVTGVNFTSATITGTAAGFTSGSGTVKVSDTLQFSQSIIVLTGATSNLTLNLSSPAPSSGLTINVSSNNTAAATVPSTVFIPANATNVLVPVTGVAVGSATIHASDLPNLTDVITTVSVQVVGAINLPSSVTVQAGQQTALNVTLSAAAPAGGLTVNLSSSDNTKASLSTTSVTIPAGQLAPTTQPQVTGIIVGNGIATISASGNGLTSASTSVNVTPGTASAITATGSGQSATVGQAFSTPIVVTLQDSHGNAVPNVTVVFTAPTTGPSATFASSSFVTNASGQVTVNATANSVANGSSSPTYSVSISAPSVSPSITPYSITLSNNAGAAASISVANGGQTATVGTGFNTNMVATVLDTYSNPVSGVSVTFASPTTGAGATFAPANAQNTNGQGQVSVSASANNTAGTYNSTATAAGVGTAATFSLTNKAGSPGSITAGAGGGQSQVINTQFAQPLVVTVKDSFGNPVTGVTVNFAGPSTGASIVSTTATTSASGVANGVVTANSTASTTAYTVNATVQGFANAGTATFSLTNTVAGASFIIVTPSSNGTPQSATVNTLFANQLSVTVQDSGHNPIQNQTVTFTVPSTGPSATLIGTLTTNSSGIVALTATANKISGASYNVTATVGGVSTPATFVLTNNPGAAATLAAGTGGGQSANLGTQFTNPLVVTVTDQYGNAVADGTTVSFVGPSTGASVSSTTANTSSGVASAHVTANSTLGSYNVTASVSGTGSTATFALSNTTQPASVSPVSGSGQSATVGTAFSQPLKALVQDVNHTGIPGVTVTFGSPASGAGFSGANTAVTDGTGTATFTPTANTVAGSYPVNISVPGINTPSAFNMTNVAGATATITPVSGGSGQSATVGTAFTTALSVTVVDQYGNAVANGTSVQFAGPGSGASILATSVTTTNGTATKQVTANNIAGGPYTVTASVGSVSGTFSLTNTPGAASVVTYSSGTGQSTTINSAFAQPLVVTVTDSFGNLVSGATVTYTGPTTGPGISQTVTAQSVAGIASTPVTANASIGGPYTVKASVGTSSNAQFSLTNQAPAPAAIAVSLGSGQTTTIYNAFPTNPAALVTDAGGNPLGGVTVTFQVAFNGSTGAGGSFVTGNSTTAVTNSSGIATASTLVANGVGTTTLGGNTFNGAGFTVSASIATSPGITAATFSLTNEPTGGTQLVVTNASVGKSLQTTVTVTLPGGCQGSVACLVSLSSSDSTKVLIAASPTAVGSVSGQATLNPGDSSTIVFVQGVSSSGSATITASLSGYTNGTSTVLFEPVGLCNCPAVAATDRHSQLHHRRGRQQLDLLSPSGAIESDHPGLHAGSLEPERFWRHVGQRPGWIVPGRRGLPLAPRRREFGEFRR